MPALLQRPLAPLARPPRARSTDLHRPTRPHRPRVHNDSHYKVPYQPDRTRLAPTPAGTACPRTRFTPSSVRTRPTPDRPRRTRRRKAITEQSPQRSAATKTDNGAQGSTELPWRLQRRLQRLQRQPAALPATGGRGRATLAVEQPATPSLDTWRPTEQRTQQQSTVKTDRTATPARLRTIVSTVSCSFGDTHADIPSEAHSDEEQAHPRLTAHATGASQDTEHVGTRTDQGPTFEVVEGLYGQTDQQAGNIGRTPNLRRT